MESNILKKQQNTNKTYIILLWWHVDNFMDTIMDKTESMPEK